MEKAVQVSTLKFVFKPEDWKIEKYVMEISVPQNFLEVQPGESPLSVMEFQNSHIESGTFSKSPYYHFKGSFCRTTCQLVIKPFYLPEHVGTKTLLAMKPFRVELLAKNEIVADLMKEFPATEKTLKKDGNVSIYSATMDLSSWKDEVDLIRITWNIRVQESVARFVQIGSKNQDEGKADHFISMKNEMTSFHNSEDLSDATIRCGSEVIPIHRLTLALASPVFHKMFTTEMKEKKDGEVIIEDIDAKIVQLMIQWIYSGNIQVIELQDLMDLFKAAHKYQIDSLKNFCSAEVCSRITPENVLKLYAFGESYNEIKMQTKAMEIMKVNKKKVFEDGDISEEFVKRYPKMALELIKG